VKTSFRRRATGLSAALLMAVAACSSAPPSELTQDNALPTDIIVDPETGQTVDAETGEVVDPITGEEVVVPGSDPAADAGFPAAPGAADANASKTNDGQQAPPAAAPPRKDSADKQQTQPKSSLFPSSTDRVGITDKQLTICGHAALTFGKAFDMTAEDLNVFWDALNAEKGGIHGRKVQMTWENDNYTPTDAVKAARACEAKNPFILVGGLGFDQIPAVRNYAEQQRILYMHHTAPAKGSEGLKYSFTAYPTVDRMGEAFAQLAASKYRDKKIGIIKRDSANWEPGAVGFKALAKRLGLKIVAERSVAVNKGNYTDDILAMKNAGAEAIFLWANALEATQLVKQAKSQNYSPFWLAFPTNLMTQTLGEDSLHPPLDGVAFMTSYSYRDYTGPFAAYAEDMKLFETQYAKYRPNVKLDGVGGDLLFHNWQGQKTLHDMLLLCGADCSRNRLVDTITSYKKRPTSAACPLDFTRGDNRRGSDQLTFMQAYKSPSGKVNWRNTDHCVGPVS
jgi:ABC-type branched-subunit amino acid transport system substrate-binding protein